jgi:ribosomal protein L23
MNLSYNINVFSFIHVKKINCLIRENQKKKKHRNKLSLWYHDSYIEMKKGS